MRQSQKIEAGTLVVGGGLIGSSVAWHLARLGAENVHCVDFDLEGPLSSSELNAGGVRASFSQPVNILCSKLSIEFFASVAEEVGYRPCGYLWLVSPERLEAHHAARRRQQELGWASEVWDVAELKRQRPFIDRTEGVAEALFVPRDGLVNPNLLKNLYRARAKALGVTFHDRILVRSAEHGADGVRVAVERHEPSLSLEARAEVLSGGSAPEASAQASFLAGRVVNCAGPWAPAVAKALGYRSPSHPLRRQICIFDCRDVDLTPYGMTVDTSGVYFHPEATNGLAGFADPAEKPGASFRYDGEEFFMEKIWAPLYERSSGFERLKHLTGWAGLYEVSPDETAIVGKVEANGLGRASRIFEAHSFSGHGAMHSYAAGVGLAELIVRGRYETLDLRPLSAQRFETGAEIHEGAVI
ncbi:MAG: FAD-binding oxidoreductase [Bdellovibrionales bacterium]|nr:FAD-binding oxidoreductase [Bdellovibrionales bacterium]